MNKFKIISDFKDTKCKIENFDFNEVSECNKLTFDTQNEIACFVTSILEKHALHKSFNLVEPTKSLQHDFILDVLSEGEQGMTFKVTLKGFSEPFSVLKTSFKQIPIQQDNIIHEIAVGLILNNLRKVTPNFMFTYGGFICSPPVDRVRLSKMNELQSLFNETVNIPEKLNKLYFEILDSLSEDEFPETEDRLIFIDYLPTLRSKILKTIHKFRTQPNLKLIEKLKNELGAVLDEADKFDKNNFNKNPARDAEKLKEYLYVIDNILTNIFNHEDELKEKLRELQLTETSSKEQLKLMCATDDKTVLVLTEFFDDAITLGDFIADEDIPKRYKSEVILQCILSLIIAYKELKYKHKDLHPENVLVQKNKCTLNYKLGDKDIHLKSSYIARIIDFGFSMIEYKGEVITPIFEDEHWKSNYEEKMEESDFHWLKHLVTYLNEDSVDDFISEMLQLDDYDQIEYYLLNSRIL